VREAMPRKLEVPMEQESHAPSRAGKLDLRAIKAQAAGLMESGER